MESVLEAETIPVVAPSAAKSAPAWWRAPDHFVALLVTVVIVFLHVCLTPNIGGLWRDEVNTINLATMPSWQQVWQFHNEDSFPLLFASTVRVWAGIFGSGDESIRALGLIIGLGVVAALWISARLMRLSFPFWSLILVGANPMVIRYGDSGRGYGLSLLFLILMFGLVWRLTEKLDWRRFAWATVAAVIGVHATYYNAVLLFAICGGGCLVALNERDWRKAIVVVSVGAIAAVSMLPYAPVFLKAHEWAFLVQYHFTLPWMWTRLSEVTGSPLPIGVALWTALTLGALVVAGRVIFRQSTDPSKARKHRNVVLFCAGALVVGIVCYTGFLKLLNYYTQPWYYLSLVAFVALCLDPILSRKRTNFHAWLRAGTVALFLAFSIAPAIRAISPRHTNLDLVAEKLEEAAQPGDLILLTRWECGVTFHRYYHGRTPWMTIPPLTDFHFQSYMPILAHMHEKAPLHPIFLQAAEVLKSGHRIWLVGETPVPRAGELPPNLPPVGDGKDGWHGSAAFYSIWVKQVMYFLQLRVTQAGTLTFLDTEAVGPFENLPVHVVSGWK